MSGYTVTTSIDLIEVYCDNPSAYKSWQLQTAINDAMQHYLHGLKSKDWYDYVVRRLSPYV